MDARHEYPTDSGHPMPDRCLHCGAKRGTEQTCVTRHLPPPSRGTPPSMFLGDTTWIGTAGHAIAAEEWKCLSEAKTE
jgi:hypothetical protein